MPAWTIDIALLALLLLIAWCVYGEGLWGAALIFVNVMFAGLIAFNFYEPLAELISRPLDFMAPYAGFVSLVVLFSVVFSLLRAVTDFIAPTVVRFAGWMDQLGRIVFALATSWYMVGMLLCMAQTAPIHKQFLGYQWEHHAFWDMGIDRYWLGYVQTSTERVFYKNPPQVFDENSDFIIRYHNHRPFGRPDPALEGKS